jgi:dimethylaniline monooxygenase (N-oxide forming)
MERWGLKPRTPIYSQHATVSSTFLTNVQRHQVMIRPNVRRINGDTVEFEDGTTYQPEVIIFCTGYRIDLPYLDPSIRSMILDDKNVLKLYENVFPPHIGDSLGFIGFIQPTTGGSMTITTSFIIVIFP